MVVHRVYSEVKEILVYFQCFGTFLYPTKSSWVKPVAVFATKLKYLFGLRFNSV